MTTIKSYTDLEQSKKLAEFLPFESADMHYFVADSLEKQEINYAIRCGTPIVKTDIPCWSLAALFNMLPKSAYLEKGSSTELCRVTLPVELISSDWNLEPIDTCVEMILKLKEKNLL